MLDIYTGITPQSEKKVSRLKPIWNFHFNRYLVLILISFAIIWRLIIGYYGLAVYHYPVPPGDDAVNHLRIIHHILETRNPFIDSAYPLIFHWLVACIAELTRLNPLLIITYLTPLLLVFPVLVVFSVVKRLFSQEVALLASLLLAFNSSFPLLGYGDGNYPDILANGIFFPLVVLFLVLFFSHPSRKNLFLTLLSILGLFFTHHLSSIYLVLFLFFYLLGVLLFFRHYHFYHRIARAIYKILLGAGLIFSLAWFIFLRKAISPFMVQLWQNKGLQERFGTYWTSLTPFHDYPITLGLLPLITGLLGIIILSIWQRKQTIRQRLAALAIIVWIVVYFLLSRWAGGGLPNRALRELALPLSISGGFFIAWILEKIKRWHWLYLSMILILSFLMVWNLNGWRQGTYKFPDLFDRMVWFTRDDLLKAQIIHFNTKPSEIILSNPANPYLSLVSLRDVEVIPNYTHYNARDWADYLRVKGIRYIFIGKKPSSSPSGVVYPFFADFESKTKMLKKISFKDLVYKFADGSCLYQVNSQALDKVLHQTN